MINLSPPRPLDRFFDYMGWSPYIREHRDFPLVDFATTMSWDARKDETMIYINWSDKRTGELGAYGERVAVFPSPVLVASFQLLAGPIDAIVADYNRILNRRTRRHL